MQSLKHLAQATLLSLSLAGAAQANICVTVDLPANPNYSFNDHITINSVGGVTIAANVMTPTQAPGPNGYPTIIFVNSWVLDEHEYLIQAAQFAEQGYQVVSYSARGWGCSGGMVEVTGPEDMEDLSAVVDWIQNNTQADMHNIGISGISYGSGMALMGLAYEPRIKTAVAMSTWGDLADALYGQETPRLFWGFFLVASGFITANMDPQISQNYLNLITHQNIPSTLGWAAQRSPKNVVNYINQRQAPVYLANNFSDYLFHPNQVMRFYESLTGPKRLDLNQGTHASGEGFGLVGLENYTWNNTHLWFDHYLKGIDNGIDRKPPFTMQTDLQYTREEYSNWPIPQAHNQTYYLAPRGLFSDGQLRTTPYSSWWPVGTTILSGDSGATTGIPILSEILDAHLKTPVKTSLPLLNRVDSVIYQTGTLSQTMKIRGIPKLHLNVTPSGSKMQLIGYLYDVDFWGIGTLITHGPITKYNATAGQRNQLDMELLATAYDVPAGHKLAIAFDSLDLLYAPPTLDLYSMTFNHASNYQSTFEVPVIP